MKHISKIGMIAMAGGLLAVTSCSDFSDYNTAPGSYEASADKTLWENISGNANLSDFAAVLQRVGYDKILNASHTYTVWAPVNGSFNVDSLNNLSDEKVRKEFVENLIANYAHKESDVNDTTIYMLNEKLLKFSNKASNSLKFDTQDVVPTLPSDNSSVYNLPSANGLLYVLSNPSTFRYNGYEMISEMSGVASKFAAYVNKYESKVLDEANSVKGEIVDGVQHYDDSVVVVHNSLIEGTLRASLNNEDSLYTVLIPNDNAWTTSYDKISKYYKYLPSMTYQDLDDAALVGIKGGSTSTTSASLADPKLGAKTIALATAPSDAEIQETAAYWTDSITKQSIVENLIYSETNKRYNSKLLSGVPFVENDTLYSTSRNRVADVRGLNTVSEKPLQLSNGHARILTAYPFTDETILPEIKTTSPGRVVTAAGTGTEYVTVTPTPATHLIWNPEHGETSFHYVKTRVPSTSNYAPELDFYLKDVRSATYDVYVVMVPPVLDTEMTAEESKPYSLRVDINYTNESNVAVGGRFDGTGIQTTQNGVRRVSPFIVTCKDENGIPKVDTLHVGRITFPVCYANTNVAPNIKIMHTFNTFMSTQKRSYEQNLRVAAVILKPVYENEENVTKED